jgi:thiamine pyrophosphate-dependent acetolactate synthase large subunit-like protein
MMGVGGEEGLKQIMEAFGGRGYFVASSEDLKRVLSELKNTTEDTTPTLVNIAIDPRGPVPLNVAQHQAKEQRIH